MESACIHLSAEGSVCFLRRHGAQKQGPACHCCCLGYMSQGARGKARRDQRPGEPCGSVLCWPSPSLPLLVEARSWWGWLGQAGWRGQKDRLFWEMKGCFVVVQLLPSKHSEAFENINSLSLLALVHREAGSCSPGTARQPGARWW